MGGEKWTNKDNDVEIVAIVCPPSKILKQYKFYIIPAKVIKNHYSITISVLKENHLYKRYENTWQYFTRIQTSAKSLEFIYGEEDSKIARHLKRVGHWHLYKATEAEKENFGFELGKNVEVWMRNITTFYTAKTRTEEELIYQIINELSKTVIHELIHICAPKFGLIKREHDELDLMSCNLVVDY